MPDLHKQFRQIVALMRSTSFAAERDTAERKARLIAGKLGLTFQQALTLYEVERHAGAYGDLAAQRQQAEEALRRAEEYLRRAQSAHRQREREQREAAERRAQARQDERRRQADERRRREEAEQQQRRDTERRQAEELAARRRWEKDQKRREENARRRRERAELRKRQASVISRYGQSKADVLKPTLREAIILAAVAPWRHVTKDKRWTESLDGWSDGASFPPVHVAAAVRNAYPMPATYQEALAELRHWEARRDDLCTMLDLDPSGRDGDSLDLPMRLRFDLVRILVLHEMPLMSLPDIVDRMRRGREDGGFYGKIAEALLRDLEHVAQQWPIQVNEPCQSSLPLDARIQAAMTQDTSRSNRAIAREVGCSPTVVGRVRKAIGLESDIRIVRRNGQTYGMRRRPENA